MDTPVAVLTLQCRYAEIEALSAELYSVGTLGIEETELPGGRYQLQAYFAQPFDASQLTGSGSWSTRQPQQEDWRGGWQPVAVGRKLWLAPEWITGQAPAGRLRIAFRPGQASGTSLSEPTLLMLEALEQVLEPADTVMDAGTGSGILSAAAQQLGARHVFAVDVDETAAREARVLVRDVWCGSPRSCRPAVATLTVANINAIQLVELAPELLRITAPGGRLLLGGFTARGAGAVEKALGRAETRFERGAWLACVVRPS